MSFLDSVILGLVEGITEFLPISSTGHLILTGHILGLDQTDFLKTFEIAIQLGAILAILVLYWRKLFLSKKIFLLVSTAFLPTAVSGFLLYSFIKDILLGSNLVVLWALAIGGLALIIFEKYRSWRINKLKVSLDHRLSLKVPKFSLNSKQEIVDIENMGYWRAVGVGLFQALAVVPGVSRAAATIVGGMILRMSRVAIVEFSFLLAVPTMAAATGYDLLKSAPSFSLDQLGLLAVGFGVAFLVAILAVKWLMKFIRSNSFIGFGFYRILLALMFGLFLL